MELKPFDTINEEFEFGMIKFSDRGQSMIIIPRSKKYGYHKVLARLENIKNHPYKKNWVIGEFKVLEILK